MTRPVRALTFINTAGKRLFGILHEPAHVARPDTAVVLLSPGVKNRVAPHRLYNKMSQTLTTMGYAVFRFDFEGLGDSEGTLDERLLRELYSAIQVGRFVHDTRAALDWLETTYGYRRFIVGGLCGGAITGLFAAADDPRVVGVLGLGIPVMIDSADVDTQRFMTTGHLKSVRKRYIRALRDMRAWARFLSFQSDYRLVVRTMLVAFRKKKPAAAPQSVNATAADPAMSNANPHFAPALFNTLERRCPVLFLFADTDRLYWEFEEKFLAHHKARLDAFAELIDVRVIAQANHVLTFTDSQQQMHQLMKEWFAARFVTTSAATSAEPVGALVL
jgi:pimeloyl-ACP methyl ester carboxylesterase